MGKSPQRSRPLIHHLLQFDSALSHGVLYQLAVMNVRAGSVPPDGLTGLIENGYGSNAKPAILPVFSQQAVLAFIVLTRIDALQPACCAELPVLGMHIVEPPETIG